MLRVITNVQNRIGPLRALQYVHRITANYIISLQHSLHVGFVGLEWVHWLDLAELPRIHRLSKNATRWFTRPISWTALIQQTVFNFFKAETTLPAVLIMLVAAPVAFLSTIERGNRKADCMKFTTNYARKENTSRQPHCKTKLFAFKTPPS